MRRRGARGGYTLISLYRGRSRTEKPCNSREKQKNRPELMLEHLPRDIALYITSIFVKHAGTDDIYNLAMSSELLKSYVIHVMGYKMPEQCAEKHGPVEWATLLRGKILEVDVPSELDSLEKKYEFYALDLSTVEKATINSISSFPHILPRMPNLRSLTLTCDILSHGYESNNYTENVLLSKVSLLPLTELVLDCECPHSETRSKCIQTVIFSSTARSETQEWENRKVKSLTLSYGEDCVFWTPPHREILSVFPCIESLTCLRAPLEVPEIDKVLDHVQEVSIYSNRGSFSDRSRPLFEMLLSKLVKLEYTYVPVSAEVIDVLRTCKTLKHLKLMIADGAEENLLHVVVELGTLSISWGSCRSTSDFGPRTFYAPGMGLLPSLIEVAPNLKDLCWLHAKLLSEDLLKVLKLTGRRLRSLELSLEHQSVCHGQYFLTLLKGLAAYNPQIRFLKLGFCCDGRYDICHCGTDVSGLEEDLAAYVRILSTHAPLLDTKPIFIAKNRIMRNHLN